MLHRTAAATALIGAAATVCSSTRIQSIRAPRSQTEMRHLVINIIYNNGILITAAGAVARLALLSRTAQGLLVMFQQEDGMIFFK